MLIRSTALVSFMTASLLFAVEAAAQTPLTLDPSGQAPIARPPAPAPPPAPTININTGEAKAEAEEDPGFYFSDDLGLDKSKNSDLYGARGPVPETHVVRQGDTLWDLCSLYFSNPWEWPRIWSYNPSITNPHWIYPGDLVRLYEPGTTPINGTPGSPSSDGEGIVGDAPTQNRGFKLKRLAFVGAKELEDAFMIDGAVEERLLLSEGDDVYLRYGEKRPQVGKSYSVYEQREQVIHPKTGEVVGSFVRIRGEVAVRSARKDRRARATITRSDNVIEREYQIGPIKKVYTRVVPRRNEKSMQAHIVGALQENELFGAQQLLIIDSGKSSGVIAGNRLFVIRRGDAYPTYDKPLQQVGFDDRRFPARAIGELIVVDVGEDISLALVTVSKHEIGIGDMVLMRKDK